MKLTDARNTGRRAPCGFSAGCSSPEEALMREGTSNRHRLRAATSLLHKTIQTAEGPMVSPFTTLRRTLKAPMTSTVKTKPHGAPVHITTQAVVDDESLRLW
ncbi:MAG: hypothetical protein ACLRWQ_03530 [Flavonifractor plautii]